MQAQSKPFFAGAPDALIALASSSPVLGMQWAGQGSKEAAFDLLVASGVAAAAATAAPTPPSNTAAAAASAAADASAEQTDGGTEGGNSETAVVADVEGQGGGSTTEFYMAVDAKASSAKAKVFFDQWGEDKGTSLAG